MASLSESDSTRHESSLLDMEGVWGFIGVVIGGLMTWGIQTHAEVGRRRESRKRFTSELVGEFLQHVDLMWRGANDLMYAVVEMSGGMPEIRAEVEERRQAAFATMAEPRRMATVLIARFRVVEPDLAPVAQRLLDASETFTFAQLKTRKEERGKAEAAFLEAARKAVT